MHVRMAHWLYNKSFPTDEGVTAFVLDLTIVELDLSIAEKYFCLYFLEENTFSCAVLKYLKSDFIRPRLLFWIYKFWKSFSKFTILSILFNCWEVWQYNDHKKITKVKMNLRFVNFPNYSEVNTQLQPNIRE